MVMPIRNTAARPKRATQSTAAAAKSASRKAKKSAPSASSDELHRLRWALSVLVGDTTKKLSAAATEKFVAPANTKIAFKGTVEQDAYVYLVQVAESSRAVTTYPLDGEAIHAKAGEATRIPATGWLVTPTQGKVLAFSSPTPLRRKEIVAALAGRDPAPGQAGHKDARPAEFGTFTDAGGTKASQINPTGPADPLITKPKTVTAQAGR
ncbi:hypothetical protein WME79_43050 [Sorangium sp. So ce726]|uniref:hypothetical protein n=1 Tax=Sorangium sp. So ce726 TaxID=3133319 RepID=UPI003F62FDAB